MTKKKAKKRTQQGNQVWFIKKDDFQNALDILELAMGEPFIPPKGTAKDPLKTTTHQQRKKRKRPFN